MPKMILGYKETVTTKIIEAALEILSAKGYNNLTMDEIAEKLEISKGALYSYFKSKDDIVREIYKSCSNAMQKIIMKAAKGPDFKQIMDLIFELTSEKYQNHIRIYFETYALSWHEEPLRAIMKLEYERDFDATLKFLEDLVRKKHVREDIDTKILTHIFRAIWMEMSEGLGLGFEKKDLRENWIRTTALVLQA